MNSYLTARGYDRHLHLAYRTDGRAGNGSYIDPFNVSTPDRLDTLLRKIGPATTIRFGPGRYRTRGWCSDERAAAKTNWSPRADWRILGAGQGLTTLELIEAAVPKCKYSILGADATRLGSIEIADLTLDAAAQNFPAVHSAFMGLSLHVEHLHLHDVEIVNTGSFGPTRLECFPVFCDASRSVRIQRVRITTPRLTLSDPPDPLKDSDGGWLAICTGGGPAGWILDNEIIGDSRCLSAHAGIGVTNCDGYKISGNRIADCVAGFYNDSWSSGDIEIADNQFHNCIAAVRLDFSGNDGTARTFRVHRNRVVSRGEEGAHAFSWLGHATRTDPPSFDTVIVRDNWITAAPGRGHVAIFNARYFECAGNHFDFDGGPCVQADRVTHWIGQGANRTRNGETV